MTPTSPPPWLWMQQRYGPPPSYPNLRIPGLNSPIPPGCQYGNHAEGWGRPPVDEQGRPLYGDVFGVYVEEKATKKLNPEEEKLWGEIPENALDDEEEEEEQAPEPEEPIAVHAPGRGGGDGRQGLHADHQEVYHSWKGAVLCLLTNIPITRGPSLRIPPTRETAQRDEQPPSRRGCRCDPPH